jgi:hypothetical protein
MRVSRASRCFLSKKRANPASAARAVGAEIIINQKLYGGNNCGAGEFGMVDYRDKIYEYYCSGFFFKNVHGLNGEFIYDKAQQESVQALKYMMSWVNI